MSAPTVGALFAGYGGLELAMQQVWPDAHPAWFSQYDPQGGRRQAPSRILAHHWPDVPNLGDITAIQWADVEPVDIITGGFPCQDVSPAGKRAGLIRGVTRSGLWGAMATAVEALRPRLVVIENVRGLLSAKADSDVEQCAWCVGGAADGEPPLRALGAVLGDLADLGYDAAWVVLPASGVGAPHRRERCFVLAWPADADGARLESDWPIAGREEVAGAGRDRVSAGDDVALLPTPAVNDMGAAYTPDEWDAWTDRMRAEHGNGNGHGASLSVETLRLLKTPTAQLGVNGGSQHPDKRTAGGHGPTLADEVEHLLPTPKATNNENRSSEWANGPNLGEAVGLLPTPVTQPSTGNGHARNLGAEARARFGQYAVAIARWEAITRPAPAPTEPTGKGGAHRLSPRFVEWMQGLPDGWVTDVPGITRNDMLKALGNGVVPQQAAEAVRWLLDARATALRSAVAA